MAIKYPLRFGKYKGQDIRTVPRNYLNWLLTITLDAVMARVVPDVLAGLEPSSWYDDVPPPRPRWTPGSGESQVVSDGDGMTEVFVIRPGVIPGAGA